MHVRKEYYSCKPLPGVPDGSSDRASRGGPCDRGRWRGMRAALSTQLLASVKRRGHGGGFDSDNGAEWVIWALCTKACHMHPACAYARVSIQASLRMQVTCLWRGHCSGGAVVKTPCGLHRHAQHAPFCRGDRQVPYTRVSIPASMRVQLTCLVGCWGGANAVV